MMKIVLQRVSSASVVVDNNTIGKIDAGLLLLVGFGKQGDLPAFEPVIDKLLNLRIFENIEGKLDHSVTTIGGGILLVPQFTLLARTHKGRRPDFTDAMAPDSAQQHFDDFVGRFRQSTGLTVETGEFGADMQVNLVNQGPLTLIMEY